MTFEANKSVAATSETDAPQITLDGATVTIVGEMYTDNPCYEAALTEVTVDEAASTLRIVVSVEKSEFHPDRNLGRRLRGGGCPDSLEQSAYRVTVEFPAEQALPRTVTATQRPSPGSPQTTTTQVP